MQYPRFLLHWLGVVQNLLQTDGAKYIVHASLPGSPRAAPGEASTSLEAHQMWAARGGRTASTAAQLPASKHVAQYTRAGKLPNRSGNQHLRHRYAIGTPSIAYTPSDLDSDQGVKYWLLKQCSHPQDCLWHYNCPVNPMLH